MYFSVIQRKELYLWWKLNSQYQKQSYSENSSLLQKVKTVMSWKIQSFFRKASYINQRHTIEENSFLSSQAEQQDNFSWKDKTWRCVPYWWYDLFLRHCKERVTWTWMLFVTKHSFRWKGLKTASERNFTVKYVEKKVYLALTTLAPRFRSCSQPA